MDSTAAAAVFAIVLSMCAVLAVFFIAGAGYIRRKTEDLGRSGSHALNETGELTTAAKQAIRNYMFGLFGVGGAIVAIVAGIAGYMIDDLAKAKAIEEALKRMHEPLVAQLTKIADTSADLKALIKTVNTETFRAEVVKELSKEDSLRKALQDGLFEKVAAELARNHADRLRGLKGDPGKDAGIDEVAAALANNYGDRLRGATGEPGKDGVTPSVDAIAATMANAYADRLRGEKGEPGKDAVSPSAEAVAALLVDGYADRLRGAKGEPGKDGPTAEAVAAALVSNHGSQLRGDRGEPGKDGVSPSPEAVAVSLLSKNADQLRQILNPQPQYFRDRSRR
jgi:hypothetical protein